MTATVRNLIDDIHELFDKGDVEKDTLVFIRGQNGTLSYIKSMVVEEIQGQEVLVIRKV
jgi:hypothetical protein